ncbi:MAG TPA: YciI family protein [Patescibacteria group bacterium]|nr:YciI family protein [Patescibacteria group bacterium]
MKKFVFVYHGSDVDANASSEVMAASKDKWMAWFGTFHDKMVDGGNPFAPSGKSVTSKGVETVSAEMTPATGYTIINANSMDDAVEIAKGCPLAQENTGAVRVYEALPM